MSGAFLRRRGRTVRSLRVEHYSSAVNSNVLTTRRKAIAHLDEVLYLPSGWDAPRSWTSGGWLRLIGCTREARLRASCERGRLAGSPALRRARLPADGSPELDPVFRFAHTLIETTEMDGLDPHERLIEVLHRICEA